MPVGLPEWENKWWSNEIQILQYKLLCYSRVLLSTIDLCMKNWGSNNIDWSWTRKSGWSIDPPDTVLPRSMLCPGPLLLLAGAWCFVHTRPYPLSSAECPLFFNFVLLFYSLYNVCHSCLEFWTVLIWMLLSVTCDDNDGPFSFSNLMRCQAS